MTILQDPIKNAIWHFLNHYSYNDALFLSERLYAEVCSEEALYLLATCYYRLGKPKIVQVLLEKHGFNISECKLLYAQACWDLENYNLAERALIGGPFKIRSLSGILSDLQTEFGDSACFAIGLLGRIYQQTERPEWAEKCFLQSLKLNTFMWSSFESLCETGKKPNPEEIFNVSSYQHLGDNKINYSTLISGTPDLVQNRKKRGYFVKVLAPSQVGSNTDTASNNSQLFSQITPEGQQIPKSTLVTPMNISSTDNSLDKKNDRNISRKAILDQDDDFLRRTPSDHLLFDNSTGSYAAIQSSSTIERRFTKTQQRISQSIIGGANPLSPLTPSFGVLPLVETPSPAWERIITMTTPADLPPPCDANPPIKKMVTRQSRKSSEHLGTAPMGKLLFSSENSRRNPDISANIESSPVIRRSTRIFANSGSSVKENNKKLPKGKILQPKDLIKRNRIKQAKIANEMLIQDLSDEVKMFDSSCEKSKFPCNPPVTQLMTAQKAAVVGLVVLLQDMGKALVSLCQFECRKAVSCIDDLPSHQRETCWALNILARSYFEMTEYKQAARVFAELRLNHSHHVFGLALYSTTLWHLRDKVCLSTLAHDLIQLDSLSPETWCCVGNCFSLRKENDSALKFFTRSVQLDTKYAYAHTLLGHEYAYSDDSEKALACFRKAIHCDSRHYNAWYGIGSIYYKQENFALAEVYFKKALAVNRKSPVLMCHLGIVQHAQKRSSTALTTLSNALLLEPANVLCRFHKASILFAIERYNEALVELTELKEIIPRESVVYFLIGQIYKALGESHLAMMNFSWALDLDPKGINNHIKEAIDKQKLNDDLFESRQFREHILVNQTDDTNSTIEFMNDLMGEAEQDVIEESDESL